MIAGTGAALATVPNRGLRAQTGEIAMTDRPRLVMWGAALMAHPLAVRLEAVAESGFTHTTVFPADMKKWRRDGLSDAEITRTIEASGVGIATIDPYTCWVPGWSMEGLDEFTREFVEVSEDDVFRMAEALGTDQINLVESAGAEYERSAYSDTMGAFAERAKAHGLRPTFEFMPTSKITDLATGWDLIQASGSDVGLTFDTWHFWRSDPDHDLLRTIPMDRILEVQIADGGTQVVEDLQTDLLYHRRVPGEGDFDLVRTVDVLRGKGGIRSIGPETFSQEMNEARPDEAVRRNAAGLAGLMPELDDLT
ncbi:sugar phosphate isomerase/epimerase [Jannaschia sp. S6380]|uniref:sugar phosphate isomerase/epimerase family protein n=1 Tax=Jannaschia sp. S6380 TaxID=2926408 RepID=UPI001FF3169E|nr:TIM barrel protein [Jannaschia sp. S6380]MCK0167262.1 sugar phosphate isomerase/epimerase [Jannaschia sp. S6380]